MSIPPDQVANMSIDKVMVMLWDNHILVEWVNYSYAYGLQYLSEHLVKGSKHLDFFEDIDDKQLTHLGLHGLPPTILDWDGWWTPLGEDLTCIHLLMAHEETTNLFCCDDSNI